MKHHYQHEIQPVQTLTKYFENGRIETWLSNDAGDELYLIKADHPYNQSPIVELSGEPKEKEQL